MVVTLYCRNTKTLYVVHSPENYETAKRIEEWLHINKERVEEWFGVRISEVIRLNKGVDQDWEKIEEIYYDEECDELKI